MSLILIGLLLVAEPREPIPAACMELAQRFGLPSTLSPSEAARAIRKLNSLPADFPGAQSCKSAIAKRKV